MIFKSSKVLPAICEMVGLDEATSQTSISQSGEVELMVILSAGGLAWSALAVWLVLNKLAAAGLAITRGSLL